MPSIPQDSDTERWFNEEVRPHEGALRGYLRHFAPPSDVDDLVQEALIRTIKVRDQQDVRSIKGFLFATARNAARDLFRHRTVAKTIAIADIESITVLDESPDARELTSRRQEADLLQAAIRSLPSRCRTILILRKFDTFPITRLRTGLAFPCIPLKRSSQRLCIVANSSLGSAVTSYPDVKVYANPHR